jgi:hypothetical protein
MSDDLAKDAEGAVEDGCLVERDFMSKVAFDLLSSSTVDRYARVAIEAGSQYLLENRSTVGGSGTAILTLQRATSLWDRIVVAKQRDVGEVELAILLSALSVSGTPGIDGLLVAINTSSIFGGPRSWLIGLTQVLRQGRQKTLAEAAAATIKEILVGLPDEETRQVVLKSVMENRCPRCFDYNASGQFWCCYESRGG